MKNALTNKEMVFISSMLFGMFFGAATLATLIALGVQSVLIAQFHMMTTLAVLVEVVVSFLVNFFVRKYCIFKG